MFPKYGARGRWLAVEWGPYVEELLNQQKAYVNRHISFVELKQLADIFAALVDQKSPYTSWHSRGVATASATLGEALGFRGRDLEHLEVAGLLHDLGKLSVPVSVLDKPERLDAEEMAIIKGHPYHTTSWPRSRDVAATPFFDIDWSRQGGATSDAPPGARG